MAPPVRADPLAEKIRARKLFFVLAAITALVVTGLLVAAWSTGGSGNGYAKAGTASALTLNDASASTVADLSRRSAPTAPGRSPR